MRQDLLHSEEGAEWDDIRIVELRAHLKELNPVLSKGIYKDARKQSEKSWHLNEDSQTARICKWIWKEPSAHKSLVVKWFF